jgi:hypothetical protein
VVVVVWLRWWLRSDSVRGGGGGQEEECGPSLYAACWCRVRSHPHPSCCPAHRASHSFRCVGTAARGLVSEVVLPASLCPRRRPGSVSLFLLAGVPQRMLFSRPPPVP